MDALVEEAVRDYLYAAAITDVDPSEVGQTQLNLVPELWRWLLKQRRPPPPRMIDYAFPGQRFARVWWLAARAEEGLAKAPRIRAGVDPEHHITIDSEGIMAWAILSDRDPIKPGDDIRVTWNGEQVFKGAFSGQLTSNPNR